MKKVLLLITFFSITGLAAQHIELGPVQEAEFARFQPHIVGEDENNLYVGELDFGSSAYETTKHLIIEAFDKKTLDRLYSKEYRIEEKGGLTSMSKLEEVLFLDGYFVYFISAKYWKDSYTEVYVHRINAGDGEKEPIDTILHQKIEDLPVVGNYEKVLQRLGTYNFHTSKNDKRLVIQYNTYNYEIDRRFEKVVVLDSKMNVLLSKDFIREGEEEVIPEHKLIDDEGSIYYIENGEFVFLDYYKDYEEWREPLPTDIFESNARPVNTSASFNPAGNLVLTAAYLTEDASDTEENKDDSETREGDTQVEGTFYMEIDGFNKEIRMATVSKFNKSFIDEFLTEDMVKYELETEVDNIFNQFRYHFADSSTIVIGEAVPKFPTSFEYEHNNLVVYSFNKKGEMIWAHHIPKFQENKKGDLPNSYLSYTDENYLYILFQDDEDNFKEGKRTILDLRRVENKKYVVPVLYKFNKTTGEFDYGINQKLIQGKDLKAYPRLGYQKKQGEPVYIFLKDRKDYRLARINLE